METLKAGCFLINKKDKTIAVIYREKQNDYSFPKGHLETGETLRECAIRETEEETKRIPEILEYEPIIEKYTTPAGENCTCTMYFALDKGKSSNTSSDTHETHFIPFLDVEEKLTYPNLKKTWDSAKSTILKILK